MNPKISIIVPVYKVEQYVKECIDSILASTFTNFELLLIDDGSPDQSGAICDEYAQNDNRIKVFHKSNGGVSSARNLGLDKAKGEWVTFIDSDDLISPTFLEGLYRPIANGENVDFVQGGNTNWKGGKPTTINNSFKDFIGDDTINLLEGIVGFPYSKLFSIEIIRKGNGNCPVRFDERMKICEDMAFTYDYMHGVKRYAFVSEIGYFYRRDNESSALHTLLDDYEFGIRNYNFLMDRYDSLLNFCNLSYANLPNQSEHKASYLMTLVFTLYKDGSSPMAHLCWIKSNLSERDYVILPFYKRGGHLRKLLSIILYHKHLLLFDIITNLLYLIWKIRN